MIEQTYKCDGPNCPAVRGPSNHWLLMMTGEARRGCGYVEATMFVPWADSLADSAEGHVCGSACAHKLLDRYLETLRGKNEN